MGICLSNHIQLQVQGIPLMIPFPKLNLKDTKEELRAGSTIWKIKQNKNNEKVFRNKRWWQGCVDDETCSIAPSGIKLSGHFLMELFFSLLIALSRSLPSLLLPQWQDNILEAAEATEWTAWVQMICQAPQQPASLQPTTTVETTATSLDQSSSWEEGLNSWGREDGAGVA